MADPPAVDGPLPVAVVGAGRWGRLHAAKLAALPQVRLVAVVDREPGRARHLAREHDAIACTRVDALPGEIVAATVAVDLPRLASVTARLLERDIHVLAEKPLALDGHAARLLVELAARRRRQGLIAMHDEDCRRGRCGHRGRGPTLPRIGHHPAGIQRPGLGHQEHVALDEPEGAGREVIEGHGRRAIGLGRLVVRHRVTIASGRRIHGHDRGVIAIVRI